MKFRKRNHDASFLWDFIRFLRLFHNLFHTALHRSMSEETSFSWSNTRDFLSTFFLFYFSVHVPYCYSLSHFFKEDNRKYTAYINYFCLVVTFYRTSLQRSIASELIQSISFTEIFLFMSSREGNSVSLPPFQKTQRSTWSEDCN